MRTLLLLLSSSLAVLPGLYASTYLRATKKEPVQGLSNATHSHQSALCSKNADWILHDKARAICSKIWVHHHMRFRLGRFYAEFIHSGGAKEKLWVAESGYSPHIVKENSTFENDVVQQRDSQFMMFVRSAFTEDASVLHDVSFPVEFNDCPPEGLNDYGKHLLITFNRPYKYDGMVLFPLAGYQDPIALNSHLKNDKMEFASKKEGILWRGSTTGPPF